MLRPASTVTNGGGEVHPPKKRCLCHAARASSEQPVVSYAMESVQHAMDTAEVDPGCLLDAGDGAVVTLMTSASPPAASGTSAFPHGASQPHSGHTGDIRHSRTPAPAAPDTAAPRHAPPPDDAIVARLRSLSAHEKTLRLMEAAEKGTVGELEALLAAGADVAAEDEREMTALHYAAWVGHVEAARLLVARGAPVDAREGATRTPLHMAADCGHAAVVRLLLAASADHSARTRTGWTPLHWAAYCGRAEAAAALLEAGADREARNDSGETPLDLATQEDHQHLVDQLTST